MPLRLENLSDLAHLPFDDIIDVRAPAEYAEDHIPGAINLPVLSDEERARVGTIYKQQDPFLARKVGAALVARNSAIHLEGTLSDKPGSWRPLVYCWRGGQRSGSFASILAQIGWRVELVEGGYKAYRRLVVKTLYETPICHRFFLIDGGTGTAKTRLLSHLSEKGGQAIDLEALAEHRGSLLGGYSSGQPSQKMFESRLAATLTELDPGKPVFVEAEGNRIGELRLPPSMWKAMQDAPYFEIVAPLQARAEFLMRSYSDLISDQVALSGRLSKLSHFHSSDLLEHWQTLAADQAFEELAIELMQQHYDPRYTKATSLRMGCLAKLEMESLTDTALERAAGRMLRKVNAL